MQSRLSSDSGPDLRASVWRGVALAVLFSTAAAAADTSGSREAEATAAAPGLNPALPTIFIAGDSTAANGSPNAVGWGRMFPAFFDATKVNIANRARGGRSSRTFITEGHWERLVAELKAGDTVLIQFGHNDGGAINEEPPGSNRPLRARGSLPGIGEETAEIDNVLTKRHEVVHTFGWYLRKMIADVQAKNATPILLSLTARNYWNDGQIERGSGRFGEWTAEVAQAQRVTFIDLNRIVTDHLQALGPEETAKFFSPDRTHTLEAGAELHARFVVAGLKSVRGNPYAPFMSAQAANVPAAPAATVTNAPPRMRLPEPANPSLPSLFLIGDSTVRNGRGDGGNGQWGWGDHLAPHFDTSRINIVNRAIGGLSSRTYLTGGYWERTLALVKPGDFVMMQFGHNDDGAINDERRARGTIKGVGEETQEIENMLTKQREVVHSYGWYLRKFIADTRAKGATPVVCSLVPRKIWNDGRIRRNADDYAGWAAQVAAAEGVAFIDLNAIIAQRYDELGPEKVEPLFADEHTHTSLAGAQLNASCVVTGLRALKNNPLATFLQPTRP